ncbi:MAG TPA: condensation domain-containing protein, partial [Pseudonocardiaceae bacterium]|nr:condensation domain-containing protein [Pseudonocardiaceae bacterium]
MRSARLSFGQERFWFLERLAPGNAVYHLPVALRLRGRLDLDALRRALGAVVAAHESLRTRFVEVAGTAYQVVEDTATIPLRMVGAGSEGELTDLLHEEVRAPFELGGAPLARALLVRLAQDHHVLLVTMHHIVSDAVSLRVFLDGLAAAYGGAAVVTGTGPQYADFAQWQRERLSGPAAEQHLAFWREHLAAAPEVLELPADRVRPAVQSYRGATHRFDLDPGLVRDVEEVGARHGATPYMALLAGFVTLLHRYTGQVDIVVGTPAANRAGTELAGVIGFFVNTLVLRTRLDGDPSFAELLRRVRRTALACYEHAELPFEKLVDELSPARDLSRSPVVQVLFAVHDAASLTVPMPGLLTEPVPLDSAATQFDLVLTIERTGGGPAGVVEYSTDLFDAGTIERMAAHLTTLLAGAVAEPDRPVSQLPIA